MNNYEYITSMSFEQMVQFLKNNIDTINCKYSKNVCIENCDKCIKQYLLSEVMNANI